MQASICLSNVGTGRRQQFDETQKNHGKQDQRTEWKASKEAENKKQQQHCKGILGILPLQNAEHCSQRFMCYCFHYLEFRYNNFLVISGCILNLVIRKFVIILKNISKGAQR